MPNEGESLRQDHFYHGLLPSLRDALSFAMARPAWERTSRYELQYPLPPGQEAGSMSPAQCYEEREASTQEPYKGYKKYSCPWRACSHCGSGAVPAQSRAAPENPPPEPDHIEGLTMRMMQAMNHYQKQEHHCFICGGTDHYVWDCPHCKAFHTWW